MRFAVLQGSVLGHLYSCSVVDIEKLIEHRGLSPYLYADDTQMFICCRPGNTHLFRDTTLSGILNIEAWMCSNRLKLNPAKTEFLWFTTHRRLHFIDVSPFIIGNATIQPAMSVRNVGVLMDRDLSSCSHITRQTGTCYRTLRQAWAIRHSLTTDASRTLVSKAVLSRINYYNCIFTGLPDYSLDHLQSVVNAAARLISRHRKYHHIRWPTRPPLASSAPMHRIQTMSHGVQGPTQPRTIIYSWTVHPSYCGSCQAMATLSSAGNLVIPKSRSEFSICAFAFAEPHAWHNLPQIVDISSSLQTTAEETSFQTMLPIPDFF